MKMQLGAMASLLLISAIPASVGGVTGNFKTFLEVPPSE